MAKIFKLIELTEDNEDTGNILYYKSKKKMCSELNLTERVISATTTKYREKYNKLTDEVKLVRMNPRYQHKGFRLEILKVDDLSEYKLEDCDVKDVAGKEERKPKFTESEDGYIVHGKLRNVNITKDELRNIKNIYCTHKMTINKTALEVGLVREELTLILSAFSITKDDIPFIDDDVINMSAEEMAETTRIEKKRSYFRKLEENKVKDMEKELKRLHRNNFVFENAVKQLSNITLPKPNYCESQGNNADKTMLINLADIHAGAKFQVVGNSYGLDIMKQRFAKFTADILKRLSVYDVDKIIICNLGDTVSGLVHVANRVASEVGVNVALVEVIEQIGVLIRTLSEVTNLPIDYRNTLGNHSRFVPNKTENITDENMETLIPFSLDLMFKNYKNVTIHKAKAVDEFILYGEPIALHHGDQFRDNRKLMASRNKFYRLIYQGHFHNFDITTLNGTEVVQVGTMMGSDDYASSKQLYSRPMQLITIIDSEWNIAHYPSYFKTEGVDD